MTPDMTAVDDYDDLDFDWTTPGALGADYIPRMLELQKRHPLFWSRRQNAWIVTRHADIVAGLRDPRLSNHRYHLGLEAATDPTGQSSGSTLKTVRRWVFNVDGQDHMRLRVLLMRPFSKSKADGYRERTRAILGAYLDKFADGRTFDFSREIAGPFVAAALIDILGFSDVLDAKRAMAMADSIVVALVLSGDTASVREADAQIDALTPVIEAEIEKRRAEPRDDLLTELIHQTEDGDRLSVDDVISLFHVLVLAAIDTTANTLSLMIPVLDASEERRSDLRANTHRIATVVEELQRYICMQNLMHRIVAEDFEWHGQSLKAGQMVYFMLSVGNWDPEVYDHADQLDFDRPRQLQLTFAPGLHNCIGIHIARMELEEALLMMFARFDRVRVMEEPAYQPNYMTRCFDKLMVRLEA